jgi:hypothetical protein
MEMAFLAVNRLATDRSLRTTSDLETEHDSDRPTG